MLWDIIISVVPICLHHKNLSNTPVTVSRFSRRDDRVLASIWTDKVQLKIQIIYTGIKLNLWLEDITTHVKQHFLLMWMIFYNIQFPFLYLSCVWMNICMYVWKESFTVSCELKHVDGCGPNISVSCEIV